MLPCYFLNSYRDNWCSQCTRKEATAAASRGTCQRPTRVLSAYVNKVSFLSFIHLCVEKYNQVNKRSKKALFTATVFFFLTPSPPINTPHQPSRLSLNSPNFKIFLFFLNHRHSFRIPISLHVPPIFTLNSNDVTRIRRRHELRDSKLAD